MQPRLPSDHGMYSNIHVHGKALKTVVCLCAVLGNFGILFMDWSTQIGARVRVSDRDAGVSQLSAAILLQKSKPVCVARRRFDSLEQCIMRQVCPEQASCLNLRAHAVKHIRSTQHVFISNLVCLCWFALLGPHRCWFVALGTGGHSCNPTARHEHCTRCS